MWTTGREIEAGDVAIAFMTRDLIQPFVIEPGKDLNNKFGYYRHSDLIGLPWGSKVGSRNGKGFIHILRPTPELWTLGLPHRTQILYLADISLIVSWLNIRPGSTVIEAGTGSGSFTHSIARTVGSTGKIFTYEFHEARASKAREEFERHGMAGVTLTHRNVCKDGFTIENAADAVFLDLPAPWDAVEHAKKALRDDRTTRICCFSPCMEQVLRTVSSLNEAGFTDITMYETLLRPHEVNEVPALPSIATASDKLKQHERKREDKRMRQIAASQAKLVEKQQKRKRNEDDEDAAGVEDENETKRLKTDNDEETGAAMTIEVTSRDRDPAAQVEAKVPAAQAASVEAASIEDVGQQVVSRVVPEVRGHTSYLTFAILLPRVHDSSAVEASREATPAS
ncbi:tRNA methyltransferase complex GCD14 subunit [Peniophora sp. CONT]|nr:tRNA methyltransferase complex GCD14 subunit [Peniophora sp. CONT]